MLCQNYVLLTPRSNRWLVRTHRIVKMSKSLKYKGFRGKMLFATITPVPEDGIDILKAFTELD